MIVFNLGCSHSHSFEGWFASAAEFEVQRSKGYLSCPVCGDQKIAKGLSAPRLNLSQAKPLAHNQELSAPQQDAPTIRHPSIEQMQALWYRMAHQVILSTEDVGTQFAEEARKIHYDEAPARGIRGQVSSDEKLALADEGIEIFSLPLPDSLKEPLQ
jgi:hypothetical protein